MTDVTKLFRGSDNWYTLNELVVSSSQRSVWIVYTGAYSNTTCVGVYDTEAAAVAAADLLNKHEDAQRWKTQYHAWVEERPYMEGTL